MDRRRRTQWIGGGLLLALLAVGGWWLFAPSPPSAPAPSAAPESARTAGALALSAQQQRQLELRWASAMAATEAPLAEIPAVIAPPANARVAVTALFPGVIVRTFVVAGDNVRRGQALAVVRSAEVLTLHADLARSQARLGVAQSSARRLGQLARDGVIAGARADEADAALREVQVDAGEKRRILALSGASGADGSYTLTAPIAGRVASATGKTGDRLDGATAPFVIDALGAYEANAQLPERLVARVRPGMAVRLGGTRGTVTAVGSIVEPDTRSVLLKARLPGDSGVIAGGSATLSLLGPAPAGAVSIPASALVSLNGGDAVFVRTARGIAVRTVRIGDRSGESALVLSGLRPGEQVVAGGTSELKALALAQ